MPCLTGVKQRDEDQRERFRGHDGAGNAGAEGWGIFSFIE
jgi:hypothetical protein